MSLRNCNHEKEVAQALAAGYWPEACTPDLRAHVAACKACSQRVLLTQAFRRERASASAQPRLESPGVLWWRAQLRRRNAALERLGRPLLGAQIFAVAIALVAAATFFASQAKTGLGWFAWLLDIPRSLHFEALLPPGLQNAAGTALVAVVLLAVIAGLGGFAAYISSDKV
jgi:hypothetical protein